MDTVASASAFFSIILFDILLGACNVVVRCAEREYGRRLDRHSLGYFTATVANMHA